MSRRRFEITPELMLRAYQAGFFPMAASRDADRLHWLEPERRGILPLDRFHAPRRLLRTASSGRYRVTADQDFAAVIAACADPAPGRLDTWINPQITDIFTRLHDIGAAHSVECRDGDTLVGGLYGVAIGGAFFGESMFSRARDASKVALVHLVARLRAGGFRLLDTQYVTPHLAQFGAIEIPRDAYRRRLAEALATQATWPQATDPAEIAALAQPASAAASLP